MSISHHFHHNLLRARRVVSLAKAVGLIVCFSGGAGIAGAQAPAPVPAKQAVTAVLNSYGQAYRSRLVAIVGQKGAHQPGIWHVMAYDLKESRRLSYFQVANGRIVQSSLLSAEQSKNRLGPAFNLDDLRKNSTDVFAIANATAVAAKVGFHTMGYEIIGRGPGEGPVYTLELRDVAENVVGTMVVDGSSGKVIAANWEAQPVARAYSSPLDRIDWQRVKDTTKTVGRGIGEGFRRFGQGVRETFSGE